MWYIGDVPIVERNHGLIVSAFLFSTLAIITISVRIYTRAVLVKNLGVDDILIVAAYMGSLGYLTASIQQMRFGLGRLGIPEHFDKFLIALYATIVCYSCTQMTVKFSILFQYRRIFQTQLAKKMAFAMLCWLSIYGTVCILTSMLMCVPVAKYWHPSIPGRCLDQFMLHYFLAGFNIFNDILLLCFPVPFLRKLNVNKRVRGVLICVFTCGAFTCIVGIIRLYALYAFNSNPIDSQPIVAVDITLWSCLEIHVAMICASVPALKAFFNRFLPTALRSPSERELSAKNKVSTRQGQGQVRTSQCNRLWNGGFARGNGGPAGGDGSGSGNNDVARLTSTTSASASASPSAGEGESVRGLATATPTSDLNWKTAALDLSDDGYVDIEGGYRSGNSGEMTKEYSSSGRRMEIMVHRTFEMMTVDRAEEAERRREKDDDAELFRGFKL